MNNVRAKIVDETLLEIASNRVVLFDPIPRTRRVENEDPRIAEAQIVAACRLLELKLRQNLVGKLDRPG